MQPAQLVRLWNSYLEARDRELRNQLVEIYVPLVGYVAHRTVRNLPAYVERAEFLSYGYFGLINAVERFDPSRQVKFEVFASQRIRGAILDGLRSVDTLSKNVRRQSKAIRRAVEDQEEDQGQHGRAERTEQALPEGMSAAEARQVQVLQRMSEHRQIDGVDVSVDPAVLHWDVEGSETALLLGDIAGTLAARFANLPERNRAFLVLHYYESLSLTDVGAKVGVSDSRAGQVRLDTIKEVTR